MLLAWTGVYTSTDGTLTVTVLGDPVTNDNSLVFVNASRITGFTFAASTLSWAASASNPSSGSLAFSAPVPSGSAPVTRAVSGTIWPSGPGEPASPNASLTETVPGTIDIDTDVDTVVDNVTDNVTDTVVDNVSIIETMAAAAAPDAAETAQAELGQEGQTDPS